MKPELEDRPANQLDYNTERWEEIQTTPTSTSFPDAMLEGGSPKADESFERSAGQTTFYYQVRQGLEVRGPEAARLVNSRLRSAIPDSSAHAPLIKRWLFQLIITEVNEEEIIGLLLDEESDDESEVTMPLEKLARLSGLAKEEIVEGMGFYYQVEDDGNGTARSSFTPIRRGIYLPDEEEEHQAWLNETFRNTDS